MPQHPPTIALNYTAVLAMLFGIMYNLPECGPNASFGEFRQTQIAHLVGLICDKEISSLQND